MINMSTKFKSFIPTNYILDVDFVDIVISEKAFELELIKSIK